MSDYQKGDRVVCNLGTEKEPTYFVGTVLSQRGDKAQIVFDDGGRTLINLTGKCPVCLGKTELTKKQDDEIEANELTKWLPPLKDRPTAKVTKPAIQGKIVAPSSSAKVKAQVRLPNSNPVSSSGLSAKPLNPNSPVKEGAVIKVDGSNAQWLVLDGKRSGQMGCILNLVEYQAQGPSPATKPKTKKLKIFSWSDGLKILGFVDAKTWDKYKAF